MMSSCNCSDVAFKMKYQTEKIHLEEDIPFDIQFISVDACQPWMDSCNSYFEYFIIHFDYLIIPFHYLMIG